MRIAVDVQISIILLLVIFFMSIILVNQVRQCESVKQIIGVQSKIVLGMSLFVISLAFLNSYQYLISSIISFVLNLSPLSISSFSFEVVFVEKWFVIICTVLIAWLINASIAYYTRFKHLFISPFEMIVLATIMMTMLQQSSISIANQIMLMAIFLGFIMSGAPWVTSRLCKGELEENTTLGLFHYLDSWVCIGAGNLFGKCHQSVEEFAEKSRYKKILVKGWIGVSIFLVMITLLLTFIAYFKGYHEQMRLVILDQFVIEGVWLQVVNILSLLIGIGCFCGFYRIITSVYPLYISFFESLIPDVRLATDWIYQLKHCRPVAVIGFIGSYIASLITLMYFSFYEIETVIIPELLMIGVFGILVAKMANRSNGIKGALIASFLNGVLLTSIPTLSFYLLKALELEGTFNSLDKLFISQLLDRLFIF